MTSKRVLASLAVATTIVGAAGTLVMPIANGDALSDQNRIITGDRIKYAPECGPLVFNPTLESMAQDAKGTFAEGGFGGAYGEEGTVDASRYNGEIRFFKGYGDPQAKALNAAYQAGAGPMLSNCEFSEYGSGFARSDEIEQDYVMIIFGKPA